MKSANPEPCRTFVRILAVVLPGFLSAGVSFIVEHTTTVYRRYPYGSFARRARGKLRKHRNNNYNNEILGLSGTRQLLDKSPSGVGRAELVRRTTDHWRVEQILRETNSMLLLVPRLPHGGVFF